MRASVVCVCEFPIVDYSSVASGADCTTVAGPSSLSFHRHTRQSTGAFCTARKQRVTCTLELSHAVGRLHTTEGVTHRLTRSEYRIYTYNIYIYIYNERQGVVVTRGPSPFVTSAFLLLGGCFASLV